MLIVIETWHLKPEYVDRATEVMQEMDELVGPPAHQDPGWSGHARFLQSQLVPNQVLMVYPWRSVEEHHQLAVGEEPMLQDFYHKYCAKPREISYHTELPVDVDHDDQAPHHAPELA